jgi:hypothetical protein
MHNQRKITEGIQFSLYHIVSQDDPRDPVIINKPDEDRQYLEQLSRHQ